MHGFNLGKELLKDLCDDMLADIFLLQEHWLHPDSLYHLSNLTKSYTCFGSSDMADMISTQILLGGPFDGVAIMINNTLLPYCKLVLSNERLIAIQIGDVIVISVYFPCSSKNDFKEVTLDIISQLCSLMENHASCRIVIGGDLNCCLDTLNWSV
jgi:exonuclease III